MWPRIVLVMERLKPHERVALGLEIASRGA
jgi:hypothetical protein